MNNERVEKLSPANNIRNNQRYTKKSVIIQMKLDERRGVGAKAGQNKNCVAQGRHPRPPARLYKCYLTAFGSRRCPVQNQRAPSLQFQFVVHFFLEQLFLMEKARIGQRGGLSRVAAPPRKLTRRGRGASHYPRRKWALSGAVHTRVALSARMCVQIFTH